MNKLNASMDGEMGSFLRLKGRIMDIYTIQISVGINIYLVHFNYL